jgi:hypothetical protein
MASTKITDYAARAESLTPQFLKKNADGDQSNFALEMSAFAGQVQALENAAFQVYLYRGIDAALQYGIDQGWDVNTNQLLDDIGSIVGAPRQGETNANYSVAIKAQIQMNASQGEPERLISALQQIVTDPGSTSPVIDFIAMQPARVCLNIELPQQIPWYMQQVMDKVKSGGVSLEIQQSTERPFCFSVDGTAPWFANGKGFGINASDVNGGELATPLIRE